MSRFRQALHSGRVLLMDGAMGTQLQRMGLADLECPEAWNLTHPQKVAGVHASYFMAGARCFLTNTFQLNPLALARYSLDGQLEELADRAVSLARSVCGQDGFVLGAIGPTTSDVKASRPERKALERAVAALHNADAILLETWTTPWALRAAERASDPRFNPNGLPVLLSMSYRARVNSAGKQSVSPRPEWFADLAQDYGVAALGINCGTDIGLQEILHVLEQYREETDLPLFVRPNAGTPARSGGDWTYPVTPEMMASWLPSLLAARATMIGGCCGTTPKHIAAFRPFVEDWNRTRGFEGELP
jgi:5-methyltetrahydrofolate--homocysteine methyltransferase